ncbi:7544_t:CDS:2 [Dentiscutata heterogama]|uniref:7544_t:CDS:1 n=1 Tax=Dentiscutata heterogama TaxID=1316150 RepID=A0ACA9M8K5_9GLOM|nr:7544_t:CDS:2 [Dentiscutata heterogama]
MNLFLLRKLVSECAEKIRKAVESHLFIYDEKCLPATLSIGVAEMNSSVAHFEDLLVQADLASIIAKRQGRNQEDEDVTPLRF